MAESNAPAITPLEGFDPTTLVEEYASRADAVTSAVWQVISHSQGHGPDLVRVKEAPEPEGLESDDMWGFLFDLVEDAARLGYIGAQLDAVDQSTFRRSWMPETIEGLARTLAGLADMEIIDDEQSFDPFWTSRMDAKRAVATSAPTTLAENAA